MFDALVDGLRASIAASWSIAVCFAAILGLEIAADSVDLPIAATIAGTVAAAVALASAVRRRHHSIAPNWPFRWDRVAKLPQVITTGHALLHATPAPDALRPSEFRHGWESAWFRRTPVPPVPSFTELRALQPVSFTQRFALLSLGVVVSVGLGWHLHDTHLPESASAPRAWSPDELAALRSASDDEQLDRATRDLARDLAANSVPPAGADVQLAQLRAGQRRAIAELRERIRARVEAAAELSSIDATAPLARGLTIAADEPNDVRVETGALDAIAREAIARAANALERSGDEQAAEWLRGIAAGTPPTARPRPVDALMAEWRARRIALSRLRDSAQESTHRDTALADGGDDAARSDDRGESSDTESGTTGQDPSPEFTGFVPNERADGQPREMVDDALATFHPRWIDLMSRPEVEPRWIDVADAYRTALTASRRGSVERESSSPTEKSSPARERTP